MDTQHEYRNCANKWTNSLHDSKRLADKSFSINPMSKYKAVREIGKPKEIKETDVFNFDDDTKKAKPKPEKIVKENKDNRFIPKKDIVDKTPKLKKY
jgi:hypothetical protein